MKIIGTFSVRPGQHVRSFGKLVMRPRIRLNPNDIHRAVAGQSETNHPAIDRLKRATIASKVLGYEVR